MKKIIKSLSDYLASQASRVIEIQRTLTAIPALGPENGGDGEIEKAKFIQCFLEKLGTFKITRLDSPDSRVKCGFRPNILAHLSGKSRRCLWIFGHMDVVPPGDFDAWNSNPWELRHDGDFIYGRGVEDNQQAITSMLLLAECLNVLNIQPNFSLGLVFMADEECGSHHGLKWILDSSSQIFSLEDLFIVPDSGSRNGRLIEIAEKAQLWLKIEVLGQQCHASTPNKGINAFVASSELVCRLQELENIFSMVNPLFKPDKSTFVPTKHDSNVPSINILPGKDVFYVDCRLLPETSAMDVVNEVRRLASEIEHKYQVKILVDIIHEQKATETPKDSLIVKMLESAISLIYDVHSVPIGIGGATVAALLREKGFATAVWSCIQNTCHQPNECSSITATYKDACVFGNILFQDIKS